MEIMVKILMWSSLVAAGILCFTAPEWLLTYGQLPYTLAFAACVGSCFLCDWMLKNWF